MKKRIRIITNISNEGIYFNIYNGWLKGDHITPEEVTRLSEERADNLRYDIITEADKLRKMFSQDPSNNYSISKYKI